MGTRSVCTTGITSHVHVSPSQNILDIKIPNPVELEIKHIVESLKLEIETLNLHNETYKFN